MSERFTGFPKGAIKFFKDLERNNNKEWFHEHRNEFEEFILEPSRAFVLDMGEKLTSLSPEIIADPAVNRSLFRINRDTRFSKDKSPYKTHYAMFFWEGSRKKMECSGFYLHFEVDKLILGAGLHMFPRPVLEMYRHKAGSEDAGRELSKIVSKLEKDGIAIEGEKYKKVPSGFDPDHFNSELLKHKGLYAGVESKVPPEFHTRKLLDHSFKEFKKMQPLQRWLADNLN